MPISLTVFRTILLVAALLQLLWTLAPAAMRGRAVEAALKVGERPGHSAPPALRNVFMSRIPGLLLAVFPLALWWYLGTPNGETAFLEAFRLR